jgi:3-carboxy-cis,cis-muconate cycloisomerase
MARARANLAAAGGVLSEQKTMTGLTGRTATAEYLGAAEQLVDAALQRAGHYLKDVP